MGQRQCGLSIQMWANLIQSSFSSHLLINTVFLEVLLKYPLILVRSTSENFNMVDYNDLYLWDHFKNLSEAPVSLNP